MGCRKVLLLVLSTQHQTTEAAADITTPTCPQTQYSTWPHTGQQHTPALPAAQWQSQQPWFIQGKHPLGSADKTPIRSQCTQNTVTVWQGQQPWYIQGKHPLGPADKTPMRSECIAEQTQTRCASVQQVYQLLVRLVGLRQLPLA